jgi:PAS domain S-box-containing protein
MNKDFKWHNNILKLNEAIFLVDKEARIINLSSNAEDLFGYKAEELIHQEFFLKLLPDTLAPSYSKMFHTLLEKPDFAGKKVEITALSKEKETLYIEVSISPVLMDDQKLFIFLIQDITERKVTEKSFQEYQEFYHNITSKAFDAIVLTDDKGLISYWNPAAEKMFGYSFIEAIDRPVQELLSPDEEAIKEFDEFFANLTEDKLDENPYLDSMFEDKFLRKDGTLFDAELSVSTIKTESGINALGIFRDITERKEAEEAFKKATLKFQVVSDTAHDPIIMINEDLNIVFWNKAAERTFGYTAQEAKDHCIFDLITPEYVREKYIKEELELIQSPDEVDSIIREFIFVDRNNKEIIGEVSVSKIILDDKPHCVGIIRDITERKKAEKEMREMSDMFAAVLEASINALIIIDSKGTITHWSKAAENIFGYKSEETIGKSLHQTLAPEKYHKDINKGLKTFAKTGKGNAIGQKVELEALKKDGTSIIIELSLASFKLNNEWHAVGIASDITERKEAEEYMREMADMFKAVSEASINALIIIDGEDKITHWSKAAEKIFGYKAEEITGKKMHDTFAHKKYSELYQKGLKTFAKTGKGAAVGQKVELDAIRKDGKEIVIELSLASFKLNNKWHAVGIASDITERKKNQEKILAMSNTFKAVLDSALDAIVIIDDKNMITHWSKTAESIFGYSRKEALNNNLNALIAPEMFLKAAGFPFIDHKNIGQVCLPARTKNNQKIFIDLALSPFEVNDKWHAVGIIKDVTKEKEIQQRILDMNSLYKNILDIFDGHIYIITSDRNLQHLVSDSNNLISKPIEPIKCHKKLYNFDKPCPWCHLNDVLEGNKVKFKFKNPENNNWYICISEPFNHKGQNYALSIKINIKDLELSAFEEVKIKKEGCE